MKITPPKAKKKLQVISEHGDNREDYYYWLRDQDNPEVLDYLSQENSYLERSMSHTAHLQDLLYNELKSRLKEDDATPPSKEGNYWYYKRFEEGFQYPLYCRRIGGKDGPEEIILDQNELAKSMNFCSIGFLENSPDHRYIAYAVDDSGSECYKIIIKELATGKSWDIGINDAATSLIWDYDSQGFLYTRNDENLRPRFVFRHNLNDNKDDQLIYQESDPGFFIWLDQSEDDSSNFIVLAGNNTMEVWYEENDGMKAGFNCICSRIADHEYEVTVLDGKFLILSNYGALNYCLYLVEKDCGDPDKWTPWLPYDETVLTEAMIVYEGFVAIQERYQGQQRIRVYNKKTAESYFLDHDKSPCCLGLYNPREYKTSILRYSYSTMASPLRIFDFDMSSRTKEIVKKQEIPDPNFSEDNYETTRLNIKSRDGVFIPVTLLYKKGLRLNGQNKLFLYAYGAYGSSMDPSFSSTRISLVDRDFIYAIAHVRGGMEQGRQWYLDGKLLNKKNSFNDFIDVGEQLIKLGYTKSGYIIAKGGSAGGLLMGAVANMRPDLFGAVIAEVPFVDTLNTMLDDSLPLTTIEYNEWGNPHEKIYYDYIKSYSPYDNVTKQSYPPILAICGLNDMRVTYWEPAKWVAKLREMNQSDHPLYFKTHMEAGHAGSSGRYEYLQDVALEIAFTLEVAPKAD